jgi:hypothetical protein
MMGLRRRREDYDAMLREQLGPRLQERHNQFRRVRADGSQVVDFQASQWGSRDDVRITINLWIGVPELSEAAAESQVEQRVGALLPGGEDHWWALDISTDPALLGDKLRRVPDDRCLPWLDARRSLDHLMTLAREAPDEFPRCALGRFRDAARAIWSSRPRVPGFAVSRSLLLSRLDATAE